MAGIAGIVSKNPIRTEEQATVGNMLTVIKHRGDHYKEIFSTNKACIGFQGDEKGIFYNKDKTIYLFLDGIIYNSAELRKLFSPAQNFHNINCEEEVLIDLYERYGVKGFESINGDFVLIIWDSIREVLVASKYLSINKNIYYYLNKDSLIFASEIKSLLIHPEVKKDLDIESINNFLTFRHIPAPFTIFKDVRRLNALSAITYNNELREEKLRYFRIDKVCHISEPDILRGLYSRLEDAVIKRLNRVKDANLFLSGGLDSSTILYFLSRKSKKAVNTYTASLLRDGPFAKRVANYFACHHAESNFSAQDLINILPKALWHFEYPVNGPDSFLYYLPKISEGQRYIFWGRGAEELFYGRLDYVALDKIIKLKKLIPKRLWRLFKNYSHGIPNKNIFYKLINIIITDDIYDTYVSFREVLTEIEKKAILEERIFQYNSRSRLLPFMEFNEDLLEQYSYLTLINGFLSDTFMNINQEILNPYTDKDFISYAYSIPSNLKIRKNQPRYLLKKMMLDKMPDFIVRRKKDNWHAQTDFLVNKEKKNYYSIINRLRERGILRIDITDFFEKCRFKADEKFWALLSLEILLELFLDYNKVAEPPCLDEWTLNI